MKSTCIIILLVIGQFGGSFALSEEQGKASSDSKKFVLSVRCKLLLVNEELEFRIVNNSDFDILWNRPQSGFLDIEILVDGHLMDSDLSYGLHSSAIYDRISKNREKNLSVRTKDGGMKKGKEFYISPGSARIVKIPVDELEMRLLLKENATIRLKLRVYEIKGYNKGMQLGEVKSIPIICDIIITPNLRSEKKAK